MPHQRQLIREAVRAQLLGKTAAEDRVYATRTKAWREPELPGIEVFALEESVDAASKSTAPRRLERTLRLAVVGIVAFTANADDAADELAREIEAAMHVDETLGGTAAYSLLVSTVGPTVSEEGKVEIVGVRLVYAIDYETELAATEATGPDFTTANVRHNVGGAVHPDDEAQDHITIATE